MGAGMRQAMSQTIITLGGGSLLGAAAWLTARLTRQDDIDQLIRRERRQARKEQR